MLPPLWDWILSVIPFVSLILSSSFKHLSTCLSIPFNTQCFKFVDSKSEVCDCYSEEVTTNTFCFVTVSNPDMDSYKSFTCLVFLLCFLLLLLYFIGILNGCVVLFPGTEVGRYRWSLFHIIQSLISTLKLLKDFLSCTEISCAETVYEVYNRGPTSDIDGWGHLCMELVVAVIVS